MNPSRWLTLVVLMASGSGSSAESGCRNYSLDKFRVVEGEAFHVVPLEMPESNISDANVTWYKNASQPQTVSSDERDRIHHHGGALFLFNLRPEDSGLYIARERKPSGRCYNHPVGIEVFSASYRASKELRYVPVKNSNQNKAVHCPDPIAYTCQRFRGSFTWYKDYTLLQGQHEEMLEINNASEASEGLYTCVCSWIHNGRTFNSSGSRELIHQDSSVYYYKIISPTEKEMFADEGEAVELRCSLLCGINVQRSCRVSWFLNGEPFTEKDGYTQTVSREVEQPSRKTVDTAVLTIRSVSAHDFHTQFNCSGTGRATATLMLKRRESFVPSVVAGVCVLLFCVFAAVLVKYFAVDIALFFRPYIPFDRHTNDSRLYDAYVVYQNQGTDPLTENSLSRFVTEVLPSVLENKCGYRLFIHGRDDIPGEDRLEKVEDCMAQSRRLIVILTPGSGAGSELKDQTPACPQNSVIGGFDWQVGLHHALVQREMSVILIQLGVTGPQGYSHLPLGLQHLIRQSAPIRWKEGSRGALDWSSRFWKRVRYLMPAEPARTHTREAFPL
ncbi:interleukin-1 receptor-like 1 [Salarias fasciatus]|uniref:Interleukin-1 receptor-like 1 n=1 Tax=Salarias fasciatus TaxID=181472 RepID=A0A672HWD9_SALFA|nr:interleukin-1 receptor-like 1 [Salarias fasciatus]